MCSGIIHLHDIQVLLYMKHEKMALKSGSHSSIYQTLSPPTAALALANSVTSLVHVTNLSVNGTG